MRKACTRIFFSCPFQNMCKQYWGGRWVTRTFSSHHGCLLSSNWVKTSPCPLFRPFPATLKAPSCCLGQYWEWAQLTRSPSMLFLRIVCSLLSTEWTNTSMLKYLTLQDTALCICFECMWHYLTWDDPDESAHCLSYNVQGYVDSLPWTSRHKMWSPLGY